MDPLTAFFKGVDHGVLEAFLEGNNILQLSPLRLLSKWWCGAADDYDVFGRDVRAVDTDDALDVLVMHTSRRMGPGGDFAACCVRLRRFGFFYYTGDELGRATFGDWRVPCLPGWRLPYGEGVGANSWASSEEEAVGLKVACFRCNWGMKGYCQCFDKKRQLLEGRTACDCGIEEPKCRCEAEEALNADVTRTSHPHLVGEEVTAELAAAMDV